jgi:ankyrin repeat protein
VEIVDLLLDNGADYKAHDKNYRTVLMYACMSDNPILLSSFMKLSDIKILDRDLANNDAMKYAKNPVIRSFLINYMIENN